MFNTEQNEILVKYGIRCYLLCFLEIYVESNVAIETSHQKTYSLASDLPVDFLIPALKYTWDYIRNVWFRRFC